jgi:predicted component of type VI protein secretion system
VQPLSNVLLLGDFSGRTASSAAPVERLEPRRISVDDFDTILRELRPTISYSIERPIATRETLEFTSLGDFHPDGLFTQLAAIKTCVGIRARLAQAPSFERALRELGELGAPVSEPIEMPVDTGQPEMSGEHAESHTDLLQRLIGARPTANTSASRAVDEIIKSAFAGVADQTASPGAEAAQARLDEIMTEAMRATLNEPSFKALEANWRGAHWLLSRLEDDQARITLADVSRNALARTLDQPVEALEGTALHHLLREQLERPPALIVGLYTFNRELDDLVLLSRLGAVAARAGARFLAHGSLALCGCESPRAADSVREWVLPDDATAKFLAELRAHPVARSISLVTPRVLLRYPYGTRTDPVESFAFEELPVAPGLERFLWGNPALLAAFALAVHDPSGVVRGVPMPVYHDGGGMVQRLPLEISLGEEGAARAVQCGLSPLRCNRTSGEITPHVVTLAQAI